MRAPNSAGRLKAQRRGGGAWCVGARVLGWPVSRRPARVTLTHPFLGCRWTHQQRCNWTALTRGRPSHELQAAGGAGCAAAAAARSGRALGVCPAQPHTQQPSSGGGGRQAVAASTRQLRKPASRCVAARGPKQQRAPAARSCTAPRTAARPAPRRSQRTVHQPLSRRRLMCARTRRARRARPLRRRPPLPALPPPPPPTPLTWPLGGSRCS